MTDATQDTATTATQQQHNATEQRLPTLDELMAMQGDDHVEILNGEIIRMPGGTGQEHHYIAKQIFRALDRYAESTGIGEANMDSLIYLMNAASGLKDSFIPDVSFVLMANLQPGDDFTKPYPGVPDLAVEITSPSDTAAMIQRKNSIYLQKGTQQVWQVYPDERSVHQYKRNTLETIRVYRGSDVIKPHDLLPDFELVLDDIFKLPPWALQS